MTEKLLKSRISNQQLKMVLFTIILVTSSIFLVIELLPANNYAHSLPIPDKEGNVPLITAIQNSKSVESIDFTIFDNKTISQLAWSLQGITHGPRFRTVPSAGATYPLDILIYINSSDELTQGVYQYSPELHQLEIVSANPVSELLVTDDDINNALLDNAGAIYAIFADYSRTTDRYGQRGVRYVHLETGHAIQNFYLQTYSLGLGTKAITQFNESYIQSYFGSALTPLVLLPVGSSTDGSSVNKHFMRKSGVSSQYDQTTVEKAIASRSSVRDYVEGEIDYSVLENIVQMSLMISSSITDVPVIDLRTVIGEVNGLPVGKYHYIAETSDFNKFKDGDFRQDLQDMSINQPCVGNAQLDIVISVNTTLPSGFTDMEFFSRLLMIDTGMVAQNIYHMCMIHGLGTVVIGAFSDSEISTFLDIPANYDPIYVMPIGLTPSYGETGSGIYNDTFRRMIGLFIFIPGYAVLFMTIPSLRLFFPKRIRNIFHCGIAVFTIFLLLLHYLLIHGYTNDVFGLISPAIYIEAALGLLSDMVQIPTNINDAGYYAVNASMIFFLISSILGFVLLRKGFQYRRYLKRMHEIILYVALILACFHCIVNHLSVITNPMTFILANIITIDIYLIIRNTDSFPWKNRLKQGSK